MMARRVRHRHREFCRVIQAVDGLGSLERRPRLADALRAVESKRRQLG